MKKTLFFSALAAGALALGAADAQSPVIVQPANSVPANAPAAAPVAAASGASDLKTMLQDLQAMQTQNEATLKKQEAALVTLDELQKAVEELKVFSKRG